ncbi:hypothetical protein B0A78_10245 [Flavobacterium columnare NBRC 100251 = ATCC 23463]|uniref:hypothetical protein n=1 Tax=Flavobacterium columnare TaxID=996 RepID=UPI0007F9A878|nr:hypothetical protein [Flavobacterium columnare]ANO47958.1 hypothetical protein Pf1_02504 [Flavobacterium columnare]APT21460.1 hypothetical protein BU993_01665 [Flavobacterium columnare]PDS23115.1 hypothetical protein B0A78_10245 [Flavobacterium columnare NBRC 100251 = ATCC 23463]QOG88834.1 hypothetical protein HUE41_01695 [Flavobacterium columnare]QOG91493.1 hypothetical protein HUE42_01690 [Flavobacterium columnare]
MTNTELNTIIDELTITLANCKIDQNGIKSLVINETFFNADYMQRVNITTCPEHTATFQELLKINQPVLYWFEFDKNSVSKETLRNKYVAYREPMKYDFKNKNYRNTAAYKTDIKESDFTLYVGKVKKGFWGRLVTHLGHNKAKGTAGMQLFHWFNPKEYGDITLYYLTLDTAMENLISVLEIEMALRKKPIIGRF